MYSSPDAPHLHPGTAGSSRPSLHGRPAQNRHLVLSRDLFERARAKAGAEGLPLCEPLRRGLAAYAAAAPAEGAARRRRPALPEPARRSLVDLWHEGDRERVNAYLAALAAAGWPYRALGDALVAGGAVPGMTRQAVALRVQAAPTVRPVGLPPVPATGPRRPRRAPAADRHDYPVRMCDDDWQAVLLRAAHEGATVTAVADEVLRRYLDDDASAAVPA
ncbi:hypothetical protein [Geodermatophilus sp. SYSU D00815]